MTDIGQIRTNVTASGSSGCVLSVAVVVFPHQVCVVSSRDAEAAGAGRRSGNLTALLLHVNPADYIKT